MATHRLHPASGTLTMTGASEPVARLFRVTGLGRYVIKIPAREDAGGASSASEAATAGTAQ